MNSNKNDYYNVKEKWGIHFLLKYNSNVFGNRCRYYPIIRYDMLLVKLQHPSILASFINTTHVEVITLLELKK